MRFAPADKVNFTGSVTDAVNLAKSYDVIADSGRMVGYLSQMRAANPDVTVLGAVEGTLSTQPLATYPDAWHLHDALGHVAQTATGAYAMNPANPDWMANVAATCSAMVKQQGYDGCTLTYLGVGALESPWKSGTPVNPATHHPYTAAEWLAATSTLAANTTSSVSPHPVVPEGLQDGPSYFAPTAPSSQLLRGAAGAIGEQWLRIREAPASQFPTATAWKQNVDALVDAGNKGRSVVAVTKMWGTGTQAEVDAWHRYALASFLLGNNGGSYFTFTTAQSWPTALADSPWEHLDLGTPSGPYTNQGGAYIRSFSHGFAAVNPGTTNATVTVPAGLCDLDGKPTTSMTLGPDGAEVFSPCSTGPGPGTSTAAGIWLVWGGSQEAQMVSSNTFLHGGQIIYDWAQIEPKPGVWNWQPVLQQMHLYKQMGKQTTVQINSSRTKPTWFASTYGIQSCGTLGGQEIPKYWDAARGGLSSTYANLMQDMISHLAAAIASSPDRSAVIGVRTAPNLIGTETYDPAGNNTNSACHDWTMSLGLQSYAQVMEMYYQTMMASHITPIMRSRYYYEVLHGISPQLEVQRIASELGPTKGWLFSTNGDPDTPILDGGLAETYVKNGTTIGYQESSYMGSQTSNPVSWNYWRVLMELGRGTSYIAVYGNVASRATPGQAECTAYNSAYSFANQYAGLNANPGASPGAWIAFRGGQQPDYTWFTSLLNPNDTVGYDSHSGRQMLGDPNQPYGRYARSTNVAGGRATFEVGLAPSFLSTLQGNVAITVTYLDSGRGSWTAAWGQQATQQATVQKTGSPEWKQATFTVPASALTGGLAGGANLTLTAHGDDTFFHLVQVNRA
jgi:hypothetical protein